MNGGSSLNPRILFRLRKGAGPGVKATGGECTDNVHICQPTDHS